MKFTILRTDKKNQKHLSYKEVGSMMERIRQDIKTNSVKQFRERIWLQSDSTYHIRLSHDLPHIHPVMEMQRDSNGNFVMKKYNGVVLLTTREIKKRMELEHLKSAAMQLPSTLAAFIGASGRTLKVLVRVSSQDNELPQDEEHAERFHKQAYEQVFPLYQTLLAQNLTECTPSLYDRFCMTLDEHPGYHPDATPFLVNQDHYSEQTPARHTNNDTSEKTDYQPDETVTTTTKAMMDFLNKKYEFRYNTIMGCTEYHPKDSYLDFSPVDERTLYSMTMMARLAGLDVRDKDVRRYVMSNLIKRFDPVDEFLWEVHGKWDGKDHIRQLARTVPTDNPHWPDWFYRWFLGMVAQWRGGGYKRYGNSTAPLLISRQGYNKSTFCKSLIPRELQWGYNDTVDLAERRQVLQMMSQFLLINLDEFNAIPQRIQEGFLKNVIQLASVKVKRPYGRHVEEQPRLASFIATANMNDLLSDPSGNRRFIGVELTGPIDVSVRPNYEQLYAQACAALDNHERYWFTKEEERLIMDNNRQFQLKTPAEEMFFECFALPSSDNDGEYLTAAAIFTLLKQKVGHTLHVRNIRALGRMLTNMENLRRKRTSQGTQYFVKIIGK